MNAESVAQVGDSIYQRNGVGFDVAARKSDDDERYEGWVYLGVEPLFYMVEPVSMTPAGIEDFAGMVLRRFAGKLAETLGYDEHNDGSRVDMGAILADPDQRADLLASMSDPGPDGTHIPAECRGGRCARCGELIHEFRDRWFHDNGTDLDYDHRAQYEVGDPT